MQITHAGEKAGTNWVGLAYPSEEKHGNETEKNLSDKVDAVHKNWLITGCEINFLAKLLRQKDRHPAF